MSSMRIKHSGAKYSAIVGIGERLKELELESGDKYLRLNRGVPSVTNIDLSEIVPLIDFDSPRMKVYPPNSGMDGLKTAINSTYFNGTIYEDNIHVSAGGMNALDMVFKTIDVDKVFLPEFYWGAYINLMKINSVENSTYFSFDELKENAASLKGNAVLICDPNNPIGNKYEDQMLLDLVKELNDNDVIVIWDSPYRKIFSKDGDIFYEHLSVFKNVIIVESFSKSIGLSGQRIGFIHSIDTDFNTELSINLLYQNNGVNAFAQILVEKILTSPQGQKAAIEFRRKTISDINKNIELLRKKNLLAEEFYHDSIPIGIFVIVKRSEAQLLESKIGSVGLSYFTKTEKEKVSNLSRICIAVPHSILKEYFK
ncbi:MAG: pyridoxal phosphate-dependent aminotransferase [Flavobacteriales bacterium]|nr:pyridoxal phosphate-dependent aminotransferase [Flavobacteriales bacterium]